MGKAAAETKGFHDRAVAEIGLSVLRRVRRIDSAHGHNAGRLEPSVARSGQLDAACQTVAADRRHQRRTRDAAPTIEHKLGGCHREVQKELWVVGKKDSRFCIELWPRSQPHDDSPDPALMYL